MPDLNLKKSYKVAIIVSRFNNHVTNKLLQGAEKAIKEYGLNITWILKVPGAVEIPFAANRLAKKYHADAIIALGAVIFGETDHYYYVCEQASQGCQQVALQYDIPVGFGVLTTKTTEQAVERAGGENGNAGYEAALAVIKLLSAFEKL